MEVMQSAFWNKKSVLVTGHEGFLGSWLTKTLVGAGAHVVGIDTVLNRPVSVLNGLRQQYKGIKGNIANLRLLQKIIDQAQPQFIFHLAAQAIVSKANNNPIEAFKS